MTSSATTVPTTTVPTTTVPTTTGPTAMVCFRAGGTAYAVPVAYVREVRAAADAGIAAMPAARPGVVGLMSDDMTDAGVALTVIAALGEGNEQVLLLEHGGHSFGLLVAEVTGVVTPTTPIGPPPAGQAGHFVSGVMTTPDGLLLLVDVGALDESFRG